MLKSRRKKPKDIDPLRGELQIGAVNPYACVFVRRPTTWLKAAPFSTQLDDYRPNKVGKRQILQITLLLGLIGVYFTLEPVAYVQPTNGLPFPLAMSL